MVLGGVWGCTVSWMMLGDHVFPEFFTPAFTANPKAKPNEKRAVECYTATSHPTTPLQSYTAYTALYSVVYYTAYTAYTSNSTIQSESPSDHET